MKVLYIPHPDSNEDTDDFYASFKKKHETLFYPGIEQAIEFKPEIIYLQCGGINHWDLKEIKENTNALIGQWTGDARKEVMDVVMWCKDICDQTFMAGLQPELYSQHKWLPHGVADWQFRDINPNATGVVFIGNGQLAFEGGRERNKLCERLSERQDFTWYGSNGLHGVVPFNDTPNIYNVRKFGVSHSIFDDIPYYFSNRPLHILAAGSCLLMRMFPGCKELFEHAYNCFLYEDYTELGFYLDALEDEFINQVRITGQNHVRDNFHYDVLVDKFINELIK